MTLKSPGTEMDYLFKELTQLGLIYIPLGCKDNHSQPLHFLVMGRYYIHQVSEIQMLLVVIPLPPGLNLIRQVFLRLVK